MPIPDYETLMLPVLRAFAAGKKNVGEIVPLLREEFHITPEEAEALIPSGRVTVLASRAHWARTYLAKAGLLTSAKRNHHEITERGRVLLQENPDRIDNHLLQRFEGFNGWRTASNVTASDQMVELAAPESPAIRATPEELIAQAHAELEGALQADLLERMSQMDPVRFEQLILHLLKAMGYGAGERSTHLLTKATGDGGVDGIIHEDALGLDAVYIQAKRYAAENRVGRPAVQQFIGSLTGEGANKGVFVTTSDFSREARDYLSRVQHRVVLINGSDLARLMIRHGVGVRDRLSYVIRTVDEDYFMEPTI